MLNKELSHFSESSKSGNQISEYICSTFLGRYRNVYRLVKKKDIVGMTWSYIYTIIILTIFFLLHSPSKCLAWVKKCCHIWLDQNFDLSLLNIKIWLIFMRKKQKNNFFFSKKKIQNGRLKKSAFFKIATSQIFFCKNFMDWSLG